MTKAVRRILLAGALIIIGAAAVWLARPRPVDVEAAPVSRGPLVGTVDEDGRTRIKERYIVSAPLAGRLARVTLREGDEVIADETVVAVIDPPDPSLLDARTRAEIEARARAAEAAIEQAEAAVQKAESWVELTKTEMDRTRAAADRGAAVEQELDRATAAWSMAQGEHRAATFAREVALFELEQARAALTHTTGESRSADWRFEIRAPVSGRVLRVIQESAAVVDAGSPLVEIGDPRDIELVVDVLSNEAVAIRPGAPVAIERWGGSGPLRGLVRLVEPAAFTKVSALGVEEQRVNVIIDFAGSPEERAGLGDGFRADARIVVWQVDDALLVPTGSLFRNVQTWSVFVIEDGRAIERQVRLGRLGADAAQVLDGLAVGELVIVYPSDRVRDGARVAVRED